MQIFVIVSRFFSVYWIRAGVKIKTFEAGASQDLISLGAKIFSLGFARYPGLFRLTVLGRTFLQVRKPCVIFMGQSLGSSN